MSTIHIPSSPAFFVRANLANNPVEPWLIKEYSRGIRFPGDAYSVVVALGTLGRLWSISEVAINEFLDISGEWDQNLLPRKTVLAWARENLSLASLQQAERTAIKIALRHHHSAVLGNDDSDPSVGLAHIRDDLTSVEWVLAHARQDIASAAWSNCRQNEFNLPQYGQLGFGLDMLLRCLDEVLYCDKRNNQWESLRDSLRRDERIQAVWKQESLDQAPKTWVGGLLRSVR